MRVGLISDTHGLLRPEALDFIDGADHIIHGGDIGSPAILERLAAIAPLTVVRGNNDTAPWAHAIPETARVDFGPVALYAIHDLKLLAIDPRAAGVRVVVSGHSHRPACVERDGVLYVNPGSAGRRRFTLPIAAAELFIDGDAVRARLVTLVP
ncbi:metallophosphoesterase family protein [Massilia sp. Root335]|uniref:metallophosphoesterase family protein n=1 Tax=Massilia sp. Root335 TaxID=1736517 RepID=UPI0006FB09B0|nr:metallophosphoesterase family protein [Massilia sp. Root335]KQV52031.1 phosphodiesterase [Massilia sp. Root335]